MRRRGGRGSRARAQDGFYKNCNLGFQRSDECTPPTVRSLVSRRARLDYLRGQLAAVCPESTEADAMVASPSAVPKLTRSVDIKLNARLSLRGHRNPIASSHRT